MASCVVDVFDMDCAACALQLEAALAALEGVAKPRVHFATQRARVAYDPARIDAQAILRCIDRSGYTASLVGATSREAMVRAQRKRYLWRTGLAAFCAMQVMMFTIPRYLAGEDIEREFARLLDLAALALTLPVLLFCAGGLYRGFLREYRSRRLGMDSAIVLSLSLAFSGSLWHVWIGSGALYFDSISMFVALLLAVRWWEWEQRERNRAAIESRAAQNAIPNIVVLRTENGSEVANDVAATAIVVGDRLLVREGEAYAVDGELCDARSLVDESSLTGESDSVVKLRGDTLYAGTVNVGAAVAMRATSTFEQSSASRLLQLADESARPDNATITDRIATYFVPTIAAVAAITFALFFSQSLAVALERAIAVLIVSCPCALALAAPAARARAFAHLLALGLIVRRSGSVERLAQANAFVLDKTGTLTRATELRIASLRDGFERNLAAAIIVEIERTSMHPIARAACARLQSTERSVEDGISRTTNSNDKKYRADVAIEQHFDSTSNYVFRPINYGFYIDFSKQNTETPSAARRFTLNDANGWVCTIEAEEALRPGARPLVQALKRIGHVEILSGDGKERVRATAHRLGIAHARAECSAQTKAQRVAELQREGHTVAVIGDGINDSIAFAGADVAIAASDALDQLRASADIVCIRENVFAIAQAIDYAKKVSLIIRQNYAWAAAYNAIAIPFAALGWLNPIVAAVGMAASSAVVVLNVARLSAPSTDDAP